MPLQQQQLRQRGLHTLTLTSLCNIVRVGLHQNDYNAAIEQYRKHVEEEIQKRVQAEAARLAKLTNSAERTRTAVR